MALRQGVHLRRIDILVETDFDDAAMFGIGESSAAPTETRLTITLDTDSPEGQVQNLVTAALVSDPWYLALKEAQSVRPVVRVAAL